MARNKFSILVFILIGLALLGLFTQLTGNTLRFFLNILIMVGVGATIFAVIYFVFIKNQESSNEMKKYKKAVKQSKAKYSQTTNYKNSNKKSSDLHKKKRTRRAPHLRVIDGNKEKRKDRVISK